MLQIALSSMDFNVSSKVLSASHFGNFPNVLKVKSHHSGKIVEFMMDIDAARYHEGWDGEQMEYVPMDANEAPNVRKLVLYHAM